MDKALRNTLRNVVTQCRRLLEDAIGEILQGRYGIHKTGAIEKSESLTHLSSDEVAHRERVIAHLKHIDATTPRSKHGGTTKDGEERLNHEPAAVEQLIREAAFTHLNRLCAYKMMAQRGLIEDAVGRGLKSRGFLFYLGDHSEDEALYKNAQAELAYRHFLEWQNEKHSTEIGVLFSKDDIASGLFPPHRTLESVLEKLNQEELKNIWAEDETIGWIFQYFTPKELRDKARKLSAAPRNSYEMAFRNQFFTPRYVVEFLVDNTLGRTWYDMRGGETVLGTRCRYLSIAEEQQNDASHRTPHRPKNDPREIKVLDPACGSGHFLLYCFDLLQTIYEEAYSDSELGPKLQQDFPNAEEFKRQIPVLILTHNIHGIDIDLRVTQLAGLALWLRAQRAFQEIGLKAERPQVKRMNLICAEPMPGEEDLLEEFIAELDPHPLGNLIGQLVRNVFKQMKLAGETGALLRIEDDISQPIDEARKQWQGMLSKKAEDDQELAKKGALFDYRKEEAQNKLVFDIADITSEKVWRDAEEEALKTLHDYAKRASNGKELSRRLFAEDAEQGFAFIDLCRQKFDVVLMNPPFGDASIPSKPYIDGVYGDTKGDVYKAFVECFQDRLVPGGFLGIISSRTGFFLSGSGDWRERIVLRLYRPLVLADFGMGVLDAMVETAAYVLRSLTEEEDRQLTLQLAKDLKQIPTDKNDLISTKKYEETRGLKRHQANGELRRLYEAGFIKPVEGHFPRWSPLHRQKERVCVSPSASYPLLVCLRLLNEEDKRQALGEALHYENEPRRFVVSPEDFRQVPNAPFCYWVSHDIRKLFSELQSFDCDGRAIKQGLGTGDDFRFVRTSWEVLANEVCPEAAYSKNPAGSYCVLGEYIWFPFAKGGAYSPFYADVNLIVNWKRDGEEMKDFPGSIIRNQNYYLYPGLTWSDRTTSCFLLVCGLQAGSFQSKVLLDSSMAKNFRH
ncbi:MAG: Eco57I restriction-modification methylase domain-containing protein [Pyrinomonadaceae bacterium]